MQSSRENNPSTSKDNVQFYNDDFEEGDSRQKKSKENTISLSGHNLSVTLSTEKLGNGIHTILAEVKESRLVKVEIAPVKKAKEERALFKQGMDFFEKLAQQQKIDDETKSKGKENAKSIHGGAANSKPKKSTSEHTENKSPELLPVQEKIKLLQKKIDNNKPKHEEKAGKELLSLSNSQEDKISEKINCLTPEAQRTSVSKARKHNDSDTGISDSEIELNSTDNSNSPEQQNEKQYSQEDEILECIKGLFLEAQEASVPKARKHNDSDNSNSHEQQNEKQYSQEDEISREASSVPQCAQCAPKCKPRHLKKQCQIVAHIPLPYFTKNKHDSDSTINAILDKAECSQPQIREDSIEV